MKKVSYQAFKKDPGKYLKEETEIQMFGKPYVKITPIEEEPEKPKIKFDYDSYETCGQCETNIPSILIRYHMHVVHGM